MLALRFNPFNFSPFAFHSAEPGHLAFGKLVDGYGELFAHLVEGEFSDEVESFAEHSSKGGS